MAELFRIRDPFGDEIVLTEEKWAYICGKHPAIARLLSQVQRTLERPEVVYEGRLASNSKVFYKGGEIVDGLERGCWVVVVVRYTSQPAIVSTAYPARHMEGSLGNVLKMEHR